MPAERPIFGLPRVGPVRDRDQGGNGGTNGHSMSAEIGRRLEPARGVNGTEGRQSLPIRYDTDLPIPVGDNKVKQGGVVYEITGSRHRKSKLEEVINGKRRISDWL